MGMESVNRPDTAIGGSGAGSARRPWADVGTGVVSALEQSLQPAIDATIEAIGREVPSYADFGSGPLATTVRRGVEIALARLIDLRPFASHNGLGLARSPCKRPCHRPWARQPACQHAT